MSDLDFSSYISPFSWRYGSDSMRKIWSEENKRRIWRQIWVALAKAQYQEGLVSQKELKDLIKYKDKIDIKKALEIEFEVRHDVMSEIKTYAEQAKIGGGKIHLGATSMDIQDNADTIRIKKSLEIVEILLKKLLKEFSEKIGEYKDLPCMGYTHLQPAEPTTLGYRFSFYTQDLLFDLSLLEFVKTKILGKGIRGAVGTSASFVALLDEKKAEDLENTIMKDLRIEAALIASQTAPRKVEYFMASALSSIAQSLNKFAFDLRIMQSPGFGEWSEPFGTNQIGSSAMPFKRNPEKSEQICSLARLIFHLSDLARDNGSLMLLERTIDDSANRRVFLPEIFLAADEILNSAIKIVSGLVVNKNQIKKNLNKFAPFSATESVLLESVKNGANRQKMHEVLRELSMKAWDSIQGTENNPLTELLLNDKRITQFIKKEKLKDLFDPNTHIGLAPKKCTQLLKILQKIKV